METGKSRNLKVDGNLLVSLIYNQAGSVSKSLLEAVMNSIDAESSEVRVYLDTGGIHYEVHDDGIGFRSTEEIQKYFEVFGFDHSEDSRKRVYGQFGMGRAQLWAFSRTVFYSNQFSMDVDIKARGLTYISGEIDEPIKGTNIIGEFYDKKTPLELDECKRDLKEMVAYTPIPIYLNDELISTVPSARKWPIENDDAYFSFKDVTSLKVYNRGIFVCSYPAWKFGIGGVIVSKKRLELNMARNDVVVAKCEVWKRIASVVRKNGLIKTKKKKTINDNDRISLIRNWISGIIEYNDISTKAIIKDIRDRGYSLNRMLKFPGITQYPGDGVPLVADRVQTSKTAFVINEKVLDWFSVSSPDKLLKCIADLMERDSVYEHNIELIKEFPVLDFHKVAEAFNGKHEILLLKDLNDRQKVQLESIQFAGSSIIRFFRRKMKKRTIKLARSDTALAFTNGRNFIAVDIKHAAELDKGLDGVLHNLHTLVHEYCHDSSSMNQHPHDLAFYEDYHDIVGYNPMGSFACRVLERYWKQLEKNGLSVRKPTIQDLSRASVIDEYENVERVEPFKIAAKPKVQVKKSAHTQLDLF